MDEKKSNKKQLAKVFVLVAALIVLAFSGTYAYFESVLSNEPTVTSATAGIFEIESSLENAQAINNPRIVLISEEQKDTMADKVIFTVTSTNRSTVNGVFNVYLDDIKLSKNLYTEYLKWELLEGSNVVYSGDFKNVERVGTAVEGEAANVITDVKKIQLTASSLSIPKNDTKTLTFRMYLLNDAEQNQISLTEGSFNGRLYLEAVPVSNLKP